MCSTGISRVAGARSRLRRLPSTNGEVDRSRTETLRKSRAQNLRHGEERATLSHRLLSHRPPAAAGLADGARIALWLVPNVEHYEYLPRTGQPRDPWPRMPHPDVLGYSRADYGNRIGFWRTLEVIDRYRIPCTVSLNLAVYEHFPEIMAGVRGAQWEVLCHGIYNTDYLWGLSEAEERAVIADCVATHSASPAATCRAGSRRRHLDAEHAGPRRGSRASNISATGGSTTSRSR